MESKTVARSTEMIEVTGVVNLIKTGVKRNKKTVTINLSTWELIETILNKIKIVLPNEK